MWSCWLFCGVDALFVTNTGLRSYGIGQKKLWELVVLVMKCGGQWSNDGGEDCCHVNLAECTQEVLPADLHCEVASGAGSTLRPPPLSGQEMQGIHFKIKSRMHFRLNLVPYK